MDSARSRCGDGCRQAPLRRACARQRLSWLWLVCSPGLALGQPQSLSNASPPPSGEVVSRTDNHSSILLIVRADQDEKLIAQLRVELGHAPYRILELRPDDRFQPEASLALMSREQGASAAIRVDVARGRIELWLQRPDGDVLDTLDTTQDRSDTRIETLRITEALRAHGLDLGPQGLPVATEPRESTKHSDSTPPLPEPVQGLPPQPLPSATATTPPTQTPPPDEPQSDARRQSNLAPALAPPQDGLWVGAGIGITSSPGGLSPNVALSSRVGYDWQNHWSAFFFWDIPLTTRAFKGDEGTTTVRLHSLGLALSRVLHESRLIAIYAGVGSQGHRFAVEGVASPGYVGTQEYHVLFSSFAVVMLGLRASKELTLVVQAQAGAAYSAFKIRRPDSSAPSWGRPLLSNSLSLQYRF